MLEFFRGNDNSHNKNQLTSIFNLCVLWQDYVAHIEKHIGLNICEMK